MDDVRNAIEGIARRAAAANAPKEGDYMGDDGLLYCGTCHTRKQCLVEMYGKYRKMPCVCECKKREALEAAKKEAAEQAERLRRRCGVSPDWTFAAAGRSQALDACKRYADRWDEMKESNVGLLLWGNVGTGKTFAAHCICNELLQRDEPVSVFIASLSRVLNSGWDKSETVTRVRNAPLVVFDDLGAERSSEYALENVFMLVDERYRARKPLIVTSNLTLNDLKNPQGMDRKRIYDRILEMCVPVYFGGASRREENASEKLRIMRELAVDAANEKNRPGR